MDIAIMETLWRNVAIIELVYGLLQVDRVAFINSKSAIKNVCSCFIWQTCSNTSCGSIEMDLTLTAPVFSAWWIATTCDTFPLRLKRASFSLLSWLCSFRSGNTLARRHHPHWLLIKGLSSLVSIVSRNHDHSLLLVCILRKLILHLEQILRSVRIHLCSVVSINLIS